MPLQASNMVSGLSPVDMLHLHLLVFVVLLVALQAALKPLKS